VQQDRIEELQSEMETVQHRVQGLQHDIQRLIPSSDHNSSTPVVIEIESKIINEDDLKDSLKTINELAIELHEANELTQELIPTPTLMPTYTLYPTYTPYPTLKPRPTHTPLPPPTSDGQHSLEEANAPGVQPTLNPLLGGLDCDWIDGRWQNCR